MDNLNLNLDSLSEEELEEASQAFNLLSAYCIDKYYAIKTRKEGQIRKAIDYEDYCDSYYEMLPEWARW